jgi:hypothetical protein
MVGAKTHLLDDLRAELLDRETAADAALVEQIGAAVHQDAWGVDRAREHRGGWRGLYFSRDGGKNI